MTGIEDLVLVQTTRIDERLLDATFDVRDGRRAELRLAIDESVEHYRLTCGATKLNPIPRFGLVALSVR